MKTTLFLILALFLTKSYSQCNITNTVDTTPYPNNVSIGQSFTADCSGFLDYVEIEVSNSGNASGILEVYQGDGFSGTLLHSQNYNVINNTKVILTNDISLVSGLQYTFEYSALNPPTSPLGPEYHNTNAYPGGVAYFSSQVIGSGEYDWAFDVSIVASRDRTLTLNAANGTVNTNPNPTNGTYPNGTTVALTPIPDAGYTFIEWTGDASGNANPLNITMDADKNITAIFECVVNIPDTSFKSYLVSNTVVNTNGDTEISCAEAIAYQGAIIAPSQGISDLTGIEAFVNINALYCNNNQLTSLNVSNNTALQIIDCKNNQLTSLDVSNNTVLTSLDCNNNLLTILDLTNGNNTNFNVNDLDFSFNSSLNCIQVDDASYSNSNWPASITTGTPSTYNIDCNYPDYVFIPDVNFKALLVGNTMINTNGDTEIDYNEAAAYTGLIQANSSGISDLTGIEAFINITNLECFDNQLTSLDISANTALTRLVCAQNSLTVLDVSNNTALTQIQCQFNSIIDLDVSNNTSLVVLFAFNNALTGLNLANGNNMNMVASSTNPNYINNPNLVCIQVDDVSFANANWSGIKDATASYSANCSLNVDEFQISNFKLYPNPVSQTLHIDLRNIEAIDFEIYDITGKQLFKTSTKSINVSQLKKGVYILKVSTILGDIVKRFIKN